MKKRILGIGQNQREMFFPELLVFLEEVMSENDRSKEIGRPAADEMSEEQQPLHRRYHPEEEEPKKKHPILRAIGRFLLLIVFIVLSLAMTFAYSMWHEYSRQTTEGGEAVRVTIPKGATSKDVAKILQQDGILRYEYPFLVKLYLSEYRGRIRYGTYQLSRTMSIEDILKIITSTGNEFTFSIPEGYTIARTARKLEEEGVMKAAEFTAAMEKAAADFAYSSILPDKSQVFYQLEGYLYPSTYYLTEDITGDGLAAKILAEFKMRFNGTRQDQAKAKNMSVEEVLIRASMVQMETHKENEYPIIAQIIQNRIDKNMKLQFDSTVVYAVTRGLYGKEQVLYSDLKYESPYNTYLHEGLPPGPICSPSLKAIDAVLNPEPNNFLFFQEDATKQDGSNLFFETYEEHDAAAKTADKNETAASTEAAGSQEKAGDKDSKKTEEKQDGGQTE